MCVCVCVCVPQCVCMSLSRCPSIVNDFAVYYQWKVSNLVFYTQSTIMVISIPTAQRMVLEAGELVKVRTSYELLNNTGNLGHHSDGTTNYWGMQVLKLWG